MKRFIATILTVLYFTATTGFVINMHYCMGKITSANLWHPNEKKNHCSVCGMSKKKGCCEDRHKILKVDKQYDVISPAVSYNNTPIALPDYSHFSTHFSAQNFKANELTINSPPGDRKVPLYIKNCVYRI